MVRIGTGAVPAPAGVRFCAIVRASVHQREGPTPVVAGHRIVASLGEPLVAMPARALSPRTDTCLPLRLLLPALLLPA